MARTVQCNSWAGVFSSAADLAERVTVPSQKSSGGDTAIPEAVAHHLISTFTGNATPPPSPLALHCVCLAAHAEAVTGSEGRTSFVLTNMSAAKVCVHACPPRSLPHLSILAPTRIMQLLVHIACVALHIDGFKCSFDLLCKDLGQSAAELTERFRLLGCSVTKGKAANPADDGGFNAATYVATFKLPIVWPKLARKSAKK